MHTHPYAACAATKITLCVLRHIGPVCCVVVIQFSRIVSLTVRDSQPRPDGRDELHKLSNLKPAVNIYFLLPALFARASQRLSASLDILTSSASCFTIPACSGPRQSTGYYLPCQLAFYLFFIHFVKVTIFLVDVLFFQLNSLGYKVSDTIFLYKSFYGT